MRRPVTFEQCCCGWPTCSDYWLVGVGKFSQSSGFTKKEAERICELINADPDFESETVE